MASFEEDIHQSETSRPDQVKHALGDIAVDVHDGQVPAGFAAERAAPWSENTRALSEMKDHLIRLSRQAQLEPEERTLINGVAKFSARNMARLYDGGLELSHSDKFKDAAREYSHAAGRLLHGTAKPADKPLDYGSFGSDPAATVSILRKVSEAEPVIAQDGTNRSVIEDLAINGAAMLAYNLQARDALITQDKLLSERFGYMYESYQAALAVYQPVDHEQ